MDVVPPTAAEAAAAAAANINRTGTDGGDTSESTLAGDSTPLVMTRRRVVVTTTSSNSNDDDDNNTTADEMRMIPPATVIRPIHQRVDRDSSVGGGCESDQTTETTAPSPILEEPPTHRRHLTATNPPPPGSLPSPSLPSSPSRGGLASSEEESVAELEDVSEEVSVAELSEGEGSCSSVGTTARSMVGVVVVDNPLPSKVACLSHPPPPAAARKSSTTSTICSSSSTSGKKRRSKPLAKLKSTSPKTVPKAKSPPTTIASGSPPQGLLKVDRHISEETATRRQDVVAVDVAASPLVVEPNSDSLMSPPVLSAIKIPSAAALAGEAQKLSQSQQQHQQEIEQGADWHRPMSLPKFSNPENCMWISTHAANCPSEDRSSSLVNVLLQPLPPNFDSETQLPPLEPDYKTLIRLSLWSVIDGHGGGCVATYASEVLLPHIAASISRALGCAIVDRGVCTVNGQLRDANALDLDGLIKTSDRGTLGGNPNSIHYRSPFERSDSDEEEEMDDDAVTTANNRAAPPMPPPRRSPPATDEEDNNITSSDNNDDTSKVGVRLLPQVQASPNPGSASVSSVKTSVKTAASQNHGEEALLGTHSPREVAAITRAITESFLAVDEGWINSIDPVATHQTSCQSNGRWNSGACALVVFTIQRLDWTDVSGNGPDDREKMRGGPEKSRGHDTSQNRDAARRRMLDFASRAKSASSLSTVSSTSSLTTEEAVNASGLESEITETEGEDDDDKSKSRADVRRRYPARKAADSATNIPKESLISAPGGCSCHCYRAHDAILYTAHVGDCRAVMLGSAPPRTIKVRDSFADHPDTTDDESSHHSSDETECLSSSDHDADSSDDDEIMEVEKLSVGSNNSRKTTSPTNPTAATSPTTPSYMTYMRRPARRSRRRTMDDTGANAPFIALPPLEKETVHGSILSPMIEVEIGDLERHDRRKQRAMAAPGNSNGNGTGSGSGNGNGTGQGIAALVGNTSGATTGGNGGSQGSGKDPSDSSTSSQESGEAMRLILLPPVTRPIDLTTDHSAYNPAEVTAVLRRCNNAPRAISAGVGGGIKRVAGSLAVTRALGDAYLKTPLLSFLPYKSHAPYITARPEVNCRPVSSTSDKVLILATDGVWERASGEDALRWVRNFYAERIAEAERRNNRRSIKGKDPAKALPTSVILSPNYYDIRLAPASSTGNTLLASSNNSVVKGSLELEQEQERQDDQNQKMDTQSFDHHGRSRSRKRGMETAPRSPSPPSNKRRKRGGRRGNAVQCGWSRSSSVADVIVRRVLNKVRRARNISSLHALMSLPQGRARRSKHDDITACVVDLSAFVS